MDHLHIRFTKWAAWGNGFSQAVQKQPPVLWSHFHWPPAQAVLENASENGYKPAVLVSQSRWSQIFFFTGLQLALWEKKRADRKGAPINSAWIVHASKKLEPVWALPSNASNDAHVIWAVSYSPSCFRLYMYKLNSSCNWFSHRSWFSKINSSIQWFVHGADEKLFFELLASFQTIILYHQ
jgi:hypothetical protein